MKTTDKTVLSVANDLIENGVDLNGYELIVTIEKQPLTEYLQNEYEETKKRLIALKNALNDISVDGMGGRCEQFYPNERFMITDEYVIKEELDLVEVKNLHVEDAHKGDVLIDGRCDRVFIERKDFDRMAREQGKKIPIESNELTPEEQCKAILNTLEEPYRTQALDNFDINFFNPGSEVIPNIDCKSKAVLLSFYGKTSPQGEEYWSKYYKKLKLQGE